MARVSFITRNSSAPKTGHGSLNEQLSPSQLDPMPPDDKTPLGDKPAETSAEIPDDNLPSEPSYTIEEETKYLAESDEHKKDANELFIKAAYSDAIQSYNKALAACPRYLDYDIAVLRANIAACHLKSKEWKEVIDAATEALDNLNRLDPVSTGATESQPGTEPKETDAGVSGDSGRVQEVDEMTERHIELFERSQRATITDVRRIRVKALLRRAKARQETGGWASLQGAMEDYTLLNSMPTLTNLDRTAVRSALATLPARLEEAKQTEMADMMGKLKQLGNGLLKPFGLSTNNFNFVKDENSGGYSVQFNQNQ